ncbi:protein MNN4-like [Cucumis melo var. makuwa]|uniref:Protein MNN4-like n=1 Tax=Cucumis melo var. makuwa TaxID=1194695 RepID=A0A5D3C2V1_CUCMM|nr:protein MNN4-like [Cucumis melo var. makuwa]TYK04719.1 protein MNN4-like [Cucumis melo var. makuwa]
MEWEELLNKIEKLSLSTKRDKMRKTLSEELVEEFERELDNLSPLEDEVVKSSKKKKVMMKKGPLSEMTLEEEEDLEGEENEPFSDKTNKFMPMSHDSTISMDKAELLYYITEEILVNVYEIIYEPIHACVRHPRNARPFHI